MRPLEELIEHDEPGIELVREWAAGAEVACELLDPSADRDRALVETQVTTRSPMGAIVHDTGGILVDDGWLRFLGSGHARLNRTLPGWNHGRAAGFLLVADDAAGGFFAINGGAFGDDVQAMYYWPPDDLEWTPLEIGFSQFVRWSLTERMSEYYADLRWPGWREEVRALSGDRCFSFFPFLWTAEGTVAKSRRAEVPVAEAFDLKVDLVRQLGRQPD